MQYTWHGYDPSIPSLTSLALLHLSLPTSHQKSQTLRQCSSSTLFKAPLIVVFSHFQTVNFVEYPPSVLSLPLQFAMCQLTSCGLACTQACSLHHHHTKQHHHPSVTWIPANKTPCHETLLHGCRHHRIQSVPNRSNNLTTHVVESRLGEGNGWTAVWTMMKLSRLGRLSMEDEWKVEGLRLNWCSLSSCLSLSPPGFTSSEGILNQLLLHYPHNKAIIVVLIAHLCCRQSEIIGVRRREQSDIAKLTKQARPCQSEMRLIN